MAYGELFQVYRSRLYSLALLKTKRKEEAEDLLQEVFLNGLQKLHQLQKPSSFFSWLRVSLHRKWINSFLRKKHHFVESEMIEVFSENREILPEDIQSEVELKNFLHFGLNSLGQMDAETLRSFYFQNRSLLQMSHDFEAPLGTIKRRLHVARKRLACTLEKLGYEKYC